MIKLDARTGTVTVNDYELQIRLTHDEFKSRYPALIPSHQSDEIGGIRYTSYQFPALSLEGAEFNFGLTYVNQYIVGIGFSPVFPDKFDADNEDDQAMWREIQLKWIYAARSLLRSTYGEPNSISSAHVFNEGDYPPEFVKELQCWGYTFRWGGAGLSYDDQDGRHTLGIFYNLFQQIQDWDELGEECKRRIEIERQRIGKYHYTDNLAATHSVIDLLRSHFEYQSVRPMLHFMGLVFDLPRWKTRIVLDIRPECEDKDAKYKITRHDSIRRVLTSDTQVLLDTLRQYIESEKL